MTNRIRNAAAALLFLCCLVTLTSAFSLPNRSPEVSRRLASVGTAAKPAPQRTMLTLAERVAYQYAIEDVDWRHRIWPKENPRPKPSLDVIVSRDQIEQKVEDYLRDSQALADYWHRPITPDQLQAEMERMAAHTKQPGVLREIFAALGNDPFVIAECLARPVLAERVPAERVGGSSAPSLDGKFDRKAIANSWPSAPGNIARGAADLPEDDPGSIGIHEENAALKLPEISAPLDCMNDTWAATTTANAPDVRESHAAVWTGSEMIVWGGLNLSSGTLNTGARYNPATDSWTATSTVNAPSARAFHTGVWTGSEMMVWGGYNNGNDLNSGGRYNPNTDTWIPTSTANVPTGRESHTAVWTGNEMIVWGGLGCGSNCHLNTGGRYNPSTDSWTAISTTNAPSARAYHTAVWTGSEVIVWGGTDGTTNYPHTGGRYNPTTDTWAPTSLANVPTGRYTYTAVWSGSEMIVWGGVDQTFNDTNTGGRYNPITDGWIVTSTGNAPSPRDTHSAVWTGREMIIWGGHSQTTDFSDGGRYSPAADSWTPATTANAPLARESHTAVWIGNEMIVWGGLSDAGFLLNTGGKYCAQPSTPLVQSAVSRKTHGNVGSFSVNLPLSGTPGIECRHGGATSDYTIVVTFLANVSVNGNPQAALTSGIGTIGSGGVSNGGVVMTSGNVVTIPLTNVANAQTINVTLNNVNGSTNVTIPMGVLIGDVNGNGAVNASDVGLTKSKSGQSVTAANLREDVNADGSINAADVALVKSLAGTGLP